VQVGTEDGPVLPILARVAPTFTCRLPG
jgi:hypothetical protein